MVCLNFRHFVARGNLWRHSRTGNKVCLDRGIAKFWDVAAGMAPAAFDFDASLFLMAGC